MSCTFWRSLTGIYARVRANELCDGDKNMKYFHRKESQRSRRNHVNGLNDANDNWKTEKEEVHNIFTDYFEKLFASEEPNDFMEALEGIGCVVTEDMNRLLDTEPTEEEVWEALFQMHPNKAPGPDGMHALFFQKFWNIIIRDVVSFVQGWWRGNCDLEEVNRTCVVLIPKCNDPKNMGEFRPISLCNVLYKIISKTLANKLKPFLESIISISHSAFVPMRLITDNALVAFEIFHAMKRRGCEGVEKARG